MSTKRYMKFNDFKQLILEANKAKYKGGFYWAFRCPDKKNPNDWVVNFYLAWQTSEKKEESKQVFQKWINNTRSGINSSLMDGWNEIEKITVLKTIQKEYVLANCTYGFKVVSDEEIKTDLKTIKSEWKRLVTSQAGDKDTCVYTYTELKDCSDKEEEEEKAEGLVDKMINSPDKFSGYETLSQRLEKIKNMGTGEFVEKYASYGPIEAFIFKKIFDGISKVVDTRKQKKADKEEATRKAEEDAKEAEEREKKEQEKENNPPKWNDKLEKMVVIQANEIKSIELKDCIDNYELHKDSLKISIEPSDKGVTIKDGKIIFDFRNIDFSLSPGNSIDSKFTFALKSGESTDSKSIEVIVNKS